MAGRAPKPVGLGVNIPLKYIENSYLRGTISGGLQMSLKWLRWADVLSESGPSSKQTLLSFKTFQEK